MSNLQWHPMMVHFPLALTVIAFLCLFFARILERMPLRTSLASCGTWNLSIAGVTGLLTLCTGLIAAWHLRLHGAPQYSVSRHMIWATCTSQLVVLLALWRALAVPPGAAPSRLFLVILFVACAGFVVTGYYGGENVYHYALGVSGR
jgi:uncharacterized membrane protein